MKKNDPKALVIIIMVIAIWSVITHIKDLFHPPSLIKDMHSFLVMLVGAIVPGLIAYSVKNIRQKVGFYCVSMGFFLEGIIHLIGQYFFYIINLLTIAAFGMSFFALLYDFVSPSASMKNKSDK